MEININSYSSDELKSALQIDSRPQKVIHSNHASPRFQISDSISKNSSIPSHTTHRAVL